MTAHATQLEEHIRTILRVVVEHTADRRAVLVFDCQCELSRLLKDAYAATLPAAQQFDFDVVEPATILEGFARLQARDLVVLVQSSNFRLNEFRLRVDLFKRGLKVIEHPHLNRMLPSEYDAYVDALAYDETYYRTVGPMLKALIDPAHSVRLDSDGAELNYASTFEPARLNIGDYRAMKNVGGQFPIGEVFSEPTELTGVNGRVRIFAFGDPEFRVNVPTTPITLCIEAGKVVDALDSTPAFDDVIARIRRHEDVWVRELGFGLNRALTPQRFVSDVGTYERMCGVHMSLGAKHSTYGKPNLKRKEGRFHIDVFAVTRDVLIDSESVFHDGNWRVA